MKKNDCRLRMPGKEKTSEKQMIWIALDEIDAALFTGDIFHNEENLKGLKRYLIRWVREAKSIEEMLKGEKS